MSEVKQETKICVEYKLKNNEKILRQFFSEEQFQNLKEINMIEYYKILKL